MSSRSPYARTRLQRTTRLRRQAIVRRVLKHLDNQQISERDPWLADDIYVARQAVLNASNGVRDPWGFAFWWYFGKAYQKAIAIWAERDRRTEQALERCAAQIAERDHVEQPPFNLYVTALAEIALPPKKPSQSERPHDAGVTSENLEYKQLTAA